MKQTHKKDLTNATNAIIVVTESQSNATEGGERVKIVIVGKPKEIAALAAETQERQFRQMLTVQEHYQTERLNAMCRGIELLRDSKHEEADQETRSCE